LKAAKQGHGPSQLRLGFLYAEKHFTGEVNYAEAEKWFYLAAKQDADDARFRLGNFYINTKRPPNMEWALAGCATRHAAGIASPCTTCSAISSKARRKKPSNT
jgi:TPR repeat protein